MGVYLKTVNAQVLILNLTICTTTYCSLNPVVFYIQAKEIINKETDSDAKEILTESLDQMNNMLKKNDFHGGYFDRTGKPNERMCDKKGWFHCEGPFDTDKCNSFHTINPYASRGYRQLFGLWNLDHM